MQVNAPFSYLFLLQSCPKVIALDRHPHGGLTGISCIAPVSVSRQPLEFFSGGHDKKLFRWQVKVPSGDATTWKIRTSPLSEVVHTSMILSLGYRASYSWLMSGGADRRLNIFDCSKNQSILDRAKFEHPIRHIHFHPQSQHLVFLEVRRSSLITQTFD